MSATRLVVLAKQAAWLAFALIMLAGLAGCGPSGLLGRIAANRGKPAISTRVLALLSYVPEGWPQADLPGLHGPALHFLDLAQMRTDLKQPAVEHALSGQERRELVATLEGNDQALQVFPKSLDPCASDFAQVWGWDITTITAVAYVPELELSIVVGPFDRPKLIRLLAERGDSLGAAFGFDRFALPSDGLRVAVDGGTMLLAATALDLELLDLLLKAHSRGGASNDPAVQALLGEVYGAWGGVLTPSGDWAKYLKESPSISAAGDQVRLKAHNGDPSRLHAAWDLAVIAFRGTGDYFEFSAVYHYSSRKAASEDVSTVRETLEQTPLLSYPDRLLGDILIVTGIEAKGAIVAATARTKSASLLGASMRQHDDYGFFPLHDPGKQP